jgi:hypothetical protein
VPRGAGLSLTYQPIQHQRWQLRTESAAVDLSGILNPSAADWPITPLRTFRVHTPSLSRPASIYDKLITLRCQFDNVRGAAHEIGVAGEVSSPGVVVGSADLG